MRLFVLSLTGSRCVDKIKYDRLPFFFFFFVLRLLLTGFFPVIIVFSGWPGCPLLVARGARLGVVLAHLGHRDVDALGEVDVGNDAALGERRTGAVLEQTEDDVDAGLEIAGPQSCLILRFRPAEPSQILYKVSR